MVNELIDGKYEILSRIGSGGTSIVYKASRVLDNKIVAVKVMRDELPDIKEHERHFRSEAQALFQMAHKNIRKIYEVGRWNNSLYMVTEYIEGKTLKDIIAENGPLPVQKALDYAMQITAGIEHAHRKGIIHRDIKAQNILLSTDGVIKIVDFGIARILSQTTRTMGGKDVVGSVHYISPEQVQDATVDLRTDIYSIGILLYEMFTGKLPFDGVEAVSIAMKHVSQMPEQPQSINPNIPQGINDIIMKCIQKEPAKRYQSATYLREDLLLYTVNPESFTVAKIGDFTVREHHNRTDAENVNTVRNGDIDTDDKNKRYSEPIRRKREIESDKRYSGEPKKKPNNTAKKVFFYILAVILSLCIIGGAALLIISYLLPEENVQYATVPNVENLSKEAAKNVLKQEQFKKFTYYEEISNEIDEGKIVRTDPEEGSYVRVDTDIKIYVSSGPQKVLPENVIGKTLEEATRILEAQGFIVNPEGRSDATKENGMVVSQSNSSGPLAIGSTITVGYVNNIVRIDRFVPDLSGCKTVDEAKKMITDAGFTVGNYSEEKTDDISRLGIASQEPAANTNYWYIENTTPEEVKVSFTIYVISGYKCTYEYNTPEGEKDSFELEITDGNGNSVSTQKFTSTNKVVYEYTSTKIETITFELYSSDNVLIEKRKIETAIPTKEDNA